MNDGVAQAGMERLPGRAAFGETHALVDTLDGVLAVGRRGWNEARASLVGGAAERAESERLREAFGVFTDAAARLEGAYAVLRGRVEQLSAELARANGALERELEEKQVLAERQSALLAALPAGVLVIDAAGVVREANAAARSLLGNGLIGAHWEALAARFAPTDCELEWLLPGDGARRVNVQEQPLEAKSERIVLLHDVTEAHAARTRIERNERLAAMGEMAARLAHQLRTPLATAMLYAGQLERRNLADEERIRLGGRIVSRLRSLERVTREMLRFVRGERAAARTFEVAALLHDAADVVKPLMAARGIAFVCEDAAGGARLHGDRRGLGAALLSLLENAAQATDQGGKVRIEAMANSRQVRIRVIDSGAGIAPHALAKVFEPFYSTRAEGTGLGLAIVKSVVEAHGGSVDVASSPACGSSFTLVLPRLPGESTGAAACEARPAEDAPALIEREAA